MIALLLAAGAALLPADPAATRPQTLCKNAGAMQTSLANPALLFRPQDRAAARPSRLGDLPKANKEIAVNRTVAGCVVAVGVRYEVEGDGRFASPGGK